MVYILQRLVFDYVNAAGFSVSSFRLVPCLEALRASRRDRTCSYSASHLVLFLTASAVSRLERSSFTSDSSLERFVDARLGRFNTL